MPSRKLGDQKILVLVSCEWIWVRQSETLPTPRLFDLFNLNSPEALSVFALQAGVVCAQLTVLAADFTCGWILQLLRVMVQEAWQRVLGCCRFWDSSSKLLSAGGDEGAQSDIVLLQVKDSSAKNENATKLNIKIRVT